MSHTHDPAYICPNCGTQAPDNYCSQCGQPTHLHSDTFWGLISHFAAHYFHYDSKFLVTIKTLLFRPGMLTKAYWARQRMRYIPPISLYIFVSAVYFLLTIFTHKGTFEEVKGQHQIAFGPNAHDTARRVAPAGNSGLWIKAGDDPTGIIPFIDRKMDKIDEQHEGNAAGYLAETINHSIPKIFFFLIPLMAGLLHLFFLRRKSMLFADHAIFSLHFHSFTFLLFWLEFLPFPAGWHIESFLYSIVALYLIISLHSAYNVKWPRAIAYGISLFVIYGLLLLISVLLLIFIVIALA